MMVVRRVWMQCPGCWQADLYPVPDEDHYQQCQCGEKLTVIDLRDGGPFSTDRGDIEGLLFARLNNHLERICDELSARDNRALDMRDKAPYRAPVRERYEAEARAYREGRDLVKAFLSTLIPQGGAFAEIDERELDEARQNPGVQALHGAADAHLETLQNEGRIDEVDQ